MIAKKKRLILLVAAVALLFVLLGVFYVKKNVLMGDDKAAYEMIVDVAQRFKNPSSVRLASGTVSSDKDSMFCGISATNGFGARSTSYYYIQGGQITSADDYVTSLYKNTEKLNISLINKKLEQKLGTN